MKFFDDEYRKNGAS